MNIGNLFPTPPDRPRPTSVTITLPPAQTATDIYDGGCVATLPSGYCSAGCNVLINDGDPVRASSPGHWMHADCAIKQITEADTDRAWLLLADAVTRRPSAFKASDIKAVMQNVARIARRTP
jgi:hypothetical protein